MDDVICNEAYDELLTQEFNHEIEDYEDCNDGSDTERGNDCAGVQGGMIYCRNFCSSFLVFLFLFFISYVMVIVLCFCRW
jgi:1,4-dihydroxy-2-naphthoate octaprenyltransferase